MLIAVIVLAALCLLVFTDLEPGKNRTGTDEPSQPGTSKPPPTGEQEQNNNKITISKKPFEPQKTKETDK